MKHDGLRRAIQRCERAVSVYDRQAFVRAEVGLSSAYEGGLTVCITTESAALAKRGRRKTTTIAGLAARPATAADLFIKGLRRVVEDKGLVWKELA